MKKWLITGVSSGLGQALAQRALARGDRVVGTLRSEVQRAAFSASHPLACGMLLDITDHGAVLRVVAGAERELGAIDILLNNAGYGYEIPVEEADMGQARRQFEVNVFGTLAVTQAVLPAMRARRSGHILMVTSIGGLVALPGLGIYNGSKFALEGISEALAREVAGFGIHVTALKPGMFRTDFAGRSLVRGEQRIADYALQFNLIRQARRARDGKQAGDPAKAARAILAVVDAAAPPRHLLLGTDALRYARFKLDTLGDEIERWEALSAGTGAG